MRNIAEKHLKQTEALQRPMTLAGKAAWLSGIGSVFLYILLFHYNQDIRHLAEITHQGDKTLFFVPILIAFVFSLVHGAFTGHFWEALGLKAKS